MIDELLLLSGNDIPFPLARLTIHQPRLKEIAYITEEQFWPGCEFLKFDKKLLNIQDKIDLSNQSNFDIIMSMIQGKTFESQQARANIMSILALIFPNYKIILGSKAIQFQNPQTTEIIGEINSSNFQDFKEILINMFCLTNEENKQYNPSGELAKKIANMIEKGRAQRAKLAPPASKISILSRYVSILAVGENKSINNLMNYTVYQLMDEFNRYQLKVKYDIWLQSKMAGATGVEDPEDWLKDIHENKIN